jgi:hypothetical protein
MDVPQMRRRRDMERRGQQESVRSIGSADTEQHSEAAVMSFTDVRFLASVAPGATFQERNALKLLSLAGQTVMLDRAVVVDRSKIVVNVCGCLKLMLRRMFIPQRPHMPLEA